MSDLIGAIFGMISVLLGIFLTIADYAFDKLLNTFRVEDEPTAMPPSETDSAQIQQATHPDDSTASEKKQSKSVHPIVVTLGLLFASLLIVLLIRWLLS
ncbi:MAG: hypothetical protein AAGG44_03595 [Planctomycetota bacterium]